VPDADRRPPLDRFLCPLCAQALRPDGGSLRCASKHAFDVAREGYVNLLPSHHRRSARAGDSAEMVAARRAFLAAGHYAPLERALAELSGALAGGADVLDVGCGEGTLTAALAGDRVHGVDISRPAIRAAARRFPDRTFAVASGKRLPFADAAFGLVCVVMAPLAATRCASSRRTAGCCASRRAPSIWRD
jgi:Methylase involved in ubiquinone/menaquinone biosynthesis